MQYKIIFGGNGIGLMDAVNELLADGWELYGDPIDTSHQAMIKKEPVRAQWTECFAVEHNETTGESKLFYTAKNGKVYMLDPEKIMKYVDAKEVANG